MLKKLLIIIIGIFLSISLASAVYWSMPSNANQNSNFNIDINGNEFYLIEANIPSSFIIISDPSNGNFTNGIYKTYYATNLKITLRPTATGTYTISGIYSTGEGVLNLNSKTIQVNQINNPSPSCPTCPSATAFSNCENNQQIRYVYSCSSSTNYQCVQSTESQSCQVQNSTPTCEVKWICKDSNLAYQSSDCSLSSIQKCSSGCENAECKIPPNVVEPNDTISVTINPEGTKETLQSIIQKIINFIKEIFDALIFWD